MINTSELKLSVVISANQAEDALMKLRAEFGLTPIA
jgi:aspartokinase